MRRVVRVAFGLLVVAAIGLLALGLWLVHSLDTPAFREAVLRRIEAVAGTDVRAERISVSLFSGVTVQGIAVANPPPFTGDLLKADRLVLRYALWPLLARRVEVRSLLLERPQLAIAVNARGLLNYEKLGPQGPPGRAFSGPATLERLPLRILLSRISVRNGSVVFADAARARLFAAERLGLDSSLELAGSQRSGSGRASAATLRLGRRLLVRDVKGPLRISSGSLRLAPISGQLAGGPVSGEALVRFADDFRYTADLKVERAQVETLLVEGGFPGSLAGTLAARAQVEGTGGLATVRARGEARVGDCRVKDNATLRLLASLLGVAELASPELDECRVEFVESGLLVSTPVLVLKGRSLALTGRGTLRLDTSALDYQLTLALSPALFAKVTRKELRGAFRTREDGFATIGFQLTGTTDAPRTDLLARIGRGALEDALKNRLQRLLGGGGKPF